MKKQIHKSRDVTNRTRYLSTTDRMPRGRIRAHYKQLSDFERERIIGLKEAGRANRRIAHHMGRGDAAIRR
ncbi:hypothetical protein TNCV_764801 [Trichonephila clavipes]|nr:hypothetical protein TNCV_764801 [Trichonephila clavipes]